VETGNNQELIPLNRSASNPLMTASSPLRETDCWHVLGFQIHDFAQADA
jgi:hypothetical protein